MRKEILIGGFGGQGVQLMGRILARALEIGGLEVAHKPDYGAEVRGGKSSSQIVIKKTPDDWPEVMEADVLVVMSQEAYQVLIKKTKKTAMMFFDPAAVKVRYPESKNKYSIPASEIAAKLGNKQVINMVMLGGMLRITKLVSLEKVYQALKEEGKFSELNQKALIAGYESVNAKG